MTKIWLYICFIAASGWSVWSNWESCSGSCGQGTTMRNRSCNSLDTSECTGGSFESQSCSLNPCPGEAHIFDYLISIFVEEVSLLSSCTMSFMKIKRSIIKVSLIIVKIDLIHLTTQVEALTVICLYTKAKVVSKVHSLWLFLDTLNTKVKQ